MNRLFTMPLSIALLGLALPSSLAMAGGSSDLCHSFTVPGTFDTIYNGTSNTSVFVSAASVSDCAGTARAVEITCNLQSLYAATYASEAACDITLPGGQVVTARLSRLATTYSSITNSIVRVPLPAGVTVANMTGFWNFRFRDTFNDSGGLAESRVSNISVGVYSQAVPFADRTINIVDGVTTARTNPQTDTGGFGYSFIKINTADVNGAAGEYLRIDASASQGIPSDNRGQTPGYSGPFTVTIYNSNGEPLAQGTDSLTYNFGAAAPDRKDGAPGTMSAGPDTSGALYVGIMPWDVNTDALNDDAANPAYPKKLPRAYAPFCMRAEAQFASYYDYSVRVQRGTKATSPAWPDLSTVYTDRPLSSQVAFTGPSDVRLLRFRLPGPVSRAAGDWLDIDTASSSFLSANYGGVFRNDTEIALYNEAGTMIATDDDDGPQYSSALSFGAQAPTRPGAYDATNPGAAFDGRDGANLPAGEYYLAVTLYNYNFTNGFTVTNVSLPSAVTGSAYVSIRASVTPSCGPADIGSQGGVAGADGFLDNNDFIVFIDYFFNQNPIADRGVQGGVPGTDGIYDNNDFIVFIDQFFTGC